MTATGKNGIKYRLDTTPIGSGGEGDIFHAYITKVAKIYKPGAVTSELEKKLEIMIDSPPNESVLTQVAWPLDMVYDESGSCMGFIMPELNINAELSDIYKYPSALPISVHQKINIAQNICVVISEVHKAGYVFGDFNPRNIGLDKNTGLVSFLDTDTYHVVDPTGGNTYRCNVCAPGYAAPELLLKCADFITENPSASKNAYSQTPLPTFTKETDNFALAIHIFKLLMNGYTPFGGIIETASVSQSSPGVGDAAVRRDSYCFKVGYKHQSAAILPLEAFPEEIAEMFNRAFVTGKADPAVRPGAEEWHNALSRLLKDLVTCGDNPLHQYYNKNTACPYCEADRKFSDALSAASSSGPTLKQTAYTPPPPPKAPTNRGGYSLSQNQITQTPVITPGSSTKSQTPPSSKAQTPPSAAAQSTTKTASKAQTPPPAQGGKSAASSATRAGDTIAFGNILWHVLHVTGSEALILSDEIICRMPYHDKRKNVTWIESDLRRRLNSYGSDGFLSRFSRIEGARIITQGLDNRANPWHLTSGGIDTHDRVFLLSIEEAVRHFEDNRKENFTDRVTFEWKSEQYDYRRIAKDEDRLRSWWWLRSPGDTAKRAACVTSDGSIDFDGYNVNRSDGGVRPAMWIRV